jgi:excisionase family DNA binding protein
MPASNRITLSVQEAATLLGLSRNVAYDAIARGQIPSIRIGRRLLVPRLALERMLDIQVPSPSSDLQTG